MSQTTMRTIFSLFIFSLFFQACSVSPEAAPAPGAASASDQSASPGQAAGSSPQAVSSNLPKAEGWVNDFANMLNEAEEAKLSDKIAAIEKGTSVEFAVVTMDDLKGENIRQYATKLGNYWGVGKSESDNGVLILLVKNTREVNISTGLGAETILSDQDCKKIIQKDMLPFFKRNDFFSGLDTGIEKVIDRMVELNGQ